MRQLFSEQPKPFYLIFSLEMWERFGYYTVQGILALFFVKELGFTDTQSFYTFGAFSALVYGLVALGGFIGDHVLGTKRTVVLGLVVLSLGYLSLAFANQQTIFFALGLVCVGNGLFKANPSSLLAKCYKPNDSRLHGAFTLYYMAINMGSILALFLGPLVAHHYGWHAAFFLSFVGLSGALVNYALRRHTLDEVNHGADAKRLSSLNLFIVLFGALLTTLACAYLLQHVHIAEGILIAVSLIVLGFYLKNLSQLQGVARTRMWVALVLMLEAIVFFTLYQQMPTSINFFAIHNVEHRLFGIAIDPQSFQVLNPVWIMLISPVLAMWYTRSHRKGTDLAMAHKFALGMTLCGVSFTLLYFTRFFANDAGIVSSWWLVASYFFQSVGELLVSALGVAMVAELVPQAIAGFVMGMWFLASSIAGFTGAYVASLTEVPKGMAGGPESLLVYSSVFLKIGLATFCLALLMWLCSPLLCAVTKPTRLTESRA